MISGTESLQGLAFRRQYKISENVLLSFFLRGRIRGDTKYFAIEIIQLKIQIRFKIITSDNENCPCSDWVKAMKTFFIDSIITGQY